MIRNHSKSLLPTFLTALCALFLTASFAQTNNSEQSQSLYDIANAISPARIESDITTLVNFGTRHTLSETESNTRGIGAARRWIKAEFEKISAQCGGCLEVYFQSEVISGEKRIPDPVEVVSVIAIQRGTTDPDRYVIMSGDIDSRVSDVMDYTSDAPGANDNASGVAGTLEAARVLTQYKFNGSIVYFKLKSSCSIKHQRDLLMSKSEEQRHPLPPFTRESAIEKVRLAENGWNGRNAEKVSLAYSENTQWRNRSEFISGREEAKRFLERKWVKELDYRLIKELWAFEENRIAVRYAYEWHDDSGNWFRSYGNENWEFNENGLMTNRFAALNDVPISESERLFHWPLGIRPDDHPGLSELGL